MAATDEQVQQFSDAQVRPLCEAIRDLDNALRAALGQIGDVYTALNVQSPTWADNRGTANAPPHLATPNDILAMNTFFTNVKAAIEGDGQWPVAQSLCVKILPA